jgi:hypothetical protein
MEELEQILNDAGPDIKKLFATTVNLFAGPYAAGQTYKDKKEGLERVLRGH